MTQVAKIEQQSADVVSVESSLLEVIAKAARDPSVDMDKMERLLAMQERVQTRRAEIAFSEAMATMQPELPTIKKNGVIEHNGKKISDFAEWSDINKAISPILSAHGFSLSFKPSNAEKQPSVTAVLRHREGHKEEATLELPLDTSGAKNAVQAVGSSLTYGKRYAAVLILNITVEGCAQSDKMWAMLTDISHAKPMGRRHTPDDWKALAMNACGWECQFVEGLDGRPFPKGFKSSQLTKAQMSTLIDWLDAFGAEHGVQWSDEARRAA